ncbi:TadE family protein [Desulfohalobium retbaense]|uniref:TadE family protein n=1 Tax=Desulfohalobium retbaense (strain ATCC 49708 / DSM 5692 / JCM 16813 / HR100) TaxID=485915 RepID=C8X1N0_DESRD|nr:TadE family protein [Desulfohalobium retbaense]ACV68452.1 TadE family protein [Desulfohalobium retbaense DSM 5692]
MKFLFLRNDGRQKGTAAVEFAIVLLVFITLILSIFDFGIYIYNQHIVTNAGRTGARYGIVYRTTGNRISYPQIQSKINDWEDFIITFGNKNFNVPSIDTCDNYGDPLTVTITYTHDFLFLPFQKNITSTTEMRCE